MQSLLYKTLDPDNTAYPRHYLAAMPGRLPDLVKENMELNKRNIEDLSLAELEDQIILALQKECLKGRVQKNIKKQLGFNPDICNTYAKTYQFDCNKGKDKRYRQSSYCTGKNCSCN